MKDILGAMTMKKFLTKLLMNATAQHLKTRGVEYLIAVNGLIHSFCSGKGVKYHKEEKTPIILNLSETGLKQQKDLFV